MSKLEAWLQEWRSTILAGAKQYEGDTVRTVFYMDMLHHLDAVEHWSEHGDTEKAVLWTAAFAQSVQKASRIFELPALIADSYSKQQSNIAKQQHGWTAAQQQALDNELVALSDLFDTPTALYRECAARIAGMKEKQYRKIQRQAALLYPSVKSPY